jgi:MFS family permease
MDSVARTLRIGALTHRNFRLFFFGQGISLIGTWMQSVALGWLVLDLTNSPFAVGLNQALRSAGVLACTLYAGIVVDRADKRRLIVVTQLLQMVEALALGALVLAHVIAVWQVMALAVGFGLVNAFDIPARQAFLVEMVGKDDLMSAIALNSSMFNAARIVGPAVAGVVIGAAGVGPCFLANGLSYLAVLWSLGAMRLPRFVPRPAPESAWEGFRVGVGFIRGERRVLSLVFLVAVLSIFGYPFLVLMPVFARDVLQRGAAGYGALMASVGVGAMLGALGLAVAGARVPKGAMLGGAAAFAALLIAFTAVRSFALALVLLALDGCAMIVTTALANTMLQTLVPDALRGRVMAFYAFVFVGMAPLGAFQAGLVADRIGAPAAVALGAVLCLAAIAVMAWRVPELRGVAVAPGITGDVAA